MKTAKKCAAVAGYLLLMSVFFRIRLTELFDGKQFVMMLGGAVLFLLPSIDGRERKVWKEMGRHFGGCALWAGFLETFLLWIMSLKKVDTIAELMTEMAYGLRPLFYGFCIYLVFSEEQTGNKVAEQQENGSKDKAENMLKEQQENGQKDKPGNMPKDQWENVNVQENQSGDKAKDWQKKNDGIYREISASESYGIFQRMGLTRRETEIAIMICQGMGNREIAESFCISEATVKKHISNIFEKLDCNRREQIRQRLICYGDNAKLP